MGLPHSFCQLHSESIAGCERHKLLLLLLIVLLLLMLLPLLGPADLIQELFSPSFTWDCGKEGKYSLLYIKRMYSLKIVKSYLTFVHQINRILLKLGLMKAQHHA